MPAEILAQTQANYTDALTLALSQQIKEIDFSVSAPNFASCQVAKLTKGGNPVWDSTDITLEPGSGGYQNIYGIRFKSFDPANPTVVKAIAYFADDPTPLGFLPSAAQFGTNGQISVGNPMITGRINAAGGIISGTGFTITKGAAGLYTINWTTPFASVPDVVAIVDDSAAGFCWLTSNAVGATGIETVSLVIAAADRAFNFLATVPV